MSFCAVGQVFDLPAFRAHLAGLDLSWARGVCLHHTAMPDLSMRPKGWTIQHMRNLAHFYGTQLGWSAGPHLFTDEDQVFGLSPLTAPGVHARAWNRTHIGIEALGDYDTESPDEGRGAQVWQTTIEAAAAILHRLGLPATGHTVKFHRDDPATSKTCPGELVDSDSVRKRIGAELARLTSADDRAEPAPVSPAPDLRAIADAIEWQLGKLRKLHE